MPTGKAAWLQVGVFAASTLVLIGLALSRAWVAEDAFITFRTVDNFVAGHGLRFNLDERVQTFTHPLWLFANVPLYVALRDICTTTVAMGLLFSTAAYVRMGSRTWRQPAVLLFGLFLPLALSRSYLLYSTSGFENALSHLCYALFATVFLATDRTSEVRWGWLSLAVALAATNRLDTALFYAPPLLLLLLLHRRRIRIAPLLLGSLPLLAWLLFSLLYYGFPYPNTALAKLNEEIPASVYRTQGLHYVLDLLRMDPAGFLTLSAGAVITATRAVRSFGERDRDRSLRTAALGAGMLLYALYVVSIGGGFLSGRFWTLAIFASAVLWSEELAAAAERVGTRPRWRAIAAPVALAAVLVATFLTVRPTLARIPPRAEILPLPGAYKSLTRDLSWEPTRSARRFEERGRRYRRNAANDPAARVVVTPTIGLTAIGAGPDVTLVDSRALGDPLLARLPPRRARFRLIGHFPREIPDGYLHARRTGSLEQMPEPLREYYRALRSVIQDPLLSGERLRHIVAFQLGRYDPLLRAYLQGLPREQDSAAPETHPEAAPRSR